MKTWKLFEGAWIDCASLPLADRGFRYGMSVFETAAVVDGRPLLLQAHLERLAHAASDCGGVLPALPDFDFSGLGTGLLRFYFTAGEGESCAPFAGNIYVLFDEAEVGWRLAPLRVMTCAAPYTPRPGGWKSGNYWQNVDVLAMARRADCDDALVFNAAGMLVGAAMANVFLLIDGSWVTPALAAGARDGAVRSWVMGRLGAREEILEATSAGLCAAAFLTNSRVGIRSIAELDGRALKIETESIQQQYFHEVFSS
jgi:branched-subunit amino acid aminotransferase/4-amino-4-deoxychorismate lyase